MVQYCCLCRTMRWLLNPWIRDTPIRDSEQLEAWLLGSTWLNTLEVSYKSMCQHSLPAYGCLWNKGFETHSGHPIETLGKEQLKHLLWPLSHLNLDKRILYPRPWSFPPSQKTNLCSANTYCILTITVCCLKRAPPCVACDAFVGGQATMRYDSMKEIYRLQLYNCKLEAPWVCQSVELIVSVIVSWHLWRERTYSDNKYIYIHNLCVYKDIMYIYIYRL